MISLFSALITSLNLLSSDKAVFFNCLILKRINESDTSTACAVAKKYTVVCTYGATAPIYNKILDTGPDGSNDFTVAFADDTSNTKIKCTITPTGVGTQKIGISIWLGYGENNATVVMN